MRYLSGWEMLLQGCVVSGVWEPVWQHLLSHDQPSSPQIQKSWRLSKRLPCTQAKERNRFPEPHSKTLLLRPWLESGDEFEVMKTVIYFTILTMRRYPRHGGTGILPHLARRNLTLFRLLTLFRGRPHLLLFAGCVQPVAVVSTHQEHRRGLSDGLRRPD